MTTLAPPNFFGASQRSAPGPLGSFPADGDNYACRLYLSILELWDLLLSQESWSLRIKSEELNVRPLLPTASVDDPDGLVQGRGLHVGDVDMLDMAPSPPEPPEAAILSHLSEAEKWNLVRLWLSEQRDKLLVWKSGFSNVELLPNHCRSV